jgi:hypothetical protein
VPQLCLLLYRSSLQGGDELDSTIQWMKAHHGVSAWMLLCAIMRRLPLLAVCKCASSVTCEWKCSANAVH